jgi:hypothetical protein
MAMTNPVSSVIFAMIARGEFQITHAGQALDWAPLISDRARTVIKASDTFLLKRLGDMKWIDPLGYGHTFKSLYQAGLKAVPDVGLVYQKLDVRGVFICDRSTVSSWAIGEEGVMPFVGLTISQEWVHGEVRYIKIVPNPPAQPDGMQIRWEQQALSLDYKKVELAELAAYHPKIWDALDETISNWHSNAKMRYEHIDFIHRGEEVKSAIVRHAVARVK